MNNIFFNQVSLKNLAKPKVIVLDLDLTLHDVIEHYNYSVNETLIHFGINHLSEAELAEESGDNFTSTKDLLAKFFSAEKVDAALEYYYNHFLAREIPSRAVLPGADALLQNLKNKFKLPILGVTNSEEKIAKKILKDLGFLKWFDDVKGIIIDTPPKPDTFMLLKALETINHNPGPHIWFIGDRLTDTKCAKSASCTAIRYYHQHLPHDEFADILLNDHFKLINLIDKILNDNLA